MRRPASGDLIADKFRLERRFARGGMGELWAARHISLDMPVAIKLMSANALASADLVMRFEREARASAQLRHPNVVAILDHGVSDGVPFIVMELLEGQDLFARLKQRGRLSHADAAPIVLSVCKALQRAHEMGIVHRDLKPANVFLARQGDEEIVKVLDFGIAKIKDGVLGAESTKSGTILGTPFYMAPEQGGTGEKIDHRADLWSLGIIAFQMLTGKLPFTADPPIGVLAKIRYQAAPRASSVAPDLDARVDSFFARALRRDRTERFQCMREFAEAFAALGEHAPAPPNPLPSSPADSITLFQPAPPPPAAPSSPDSQLDAGVPSPAALLRAGQRLGNVTPRPAGSRTPRHSEPVIQAGQPFGDAPAPAAIPAAPCAAEPTTVTPAQARPSMSEPAVPLPVSAPAEAPTQAVRAACEPGADGGTMTSATADAAPRTALGDGRFTAIVAGAVLSALIVVAVVGWVIALGSGAPEPASAPDAAPLPLASSAALDALKPDMLKPAKPAAQSGAMSAAAPTGAPTVLPGSASGNGAPGSTAAHGSKPLPVPPRRPQVAQPPPKTAPVF